MGLKRKLLIRADGSSEIGLGHLVRCIALAHILRDDYEIVFFCQLIPRRLFNEIRKNGFECVVISSEDQFLCHLGNKDTVVLDGYTFKSDYQLVIKRTGAKLVCIDDMHDKEYFADLIINYEMGISTDDFKAQPYTRFALGPDYALLRPSFLEQVGNPRIIKKLDSVLICFGGADPYSFSGQTLGIVANLNQFRKIIVITGHAFKESVELNKAIASDRRIDYHMSLNEKQMLAAFKKSDIAILPSSGIIFEAFSVGIPVITGYYVADQEKVAKHVCKLNLALCMGNLHLGYKESLVELLDTLTIEKANQIVKNQKLFLKHNKELVRDLFKSLD